MTAPDTAKDLLAYFCTACNLDFACYSRSPKACPNCGATFGGDGDGDGRDD